MLKEALIWGLRGVSRNSIYLGYVCEMSACVLEGDDKQAAAKKAIRIIHDYAEKLQELDACVEVKVVN